MPTVGKQNYRYLGYGCQQTAYASPFSHYKEVAKPGYYSVELDRYNVTAELTATRPCTVIVSPKVKKLDLSSIWITVYKDKKTSI